MRLWLLSALVLTAGCATASVSRGPPGDAAGDVGPEALIEPFDDRGLERAEDDLDSGRWVEAARAADSLYALWRGRPDLTRDAGRRLARLLAAQAEDLRAAELLLYSPADPGGRELDVLREVAGRLSLGELESLTVDSTTAPEAGAVVRTQLASALALGGFADSARAIALGVLESQARSEERNLARDVAAGRVQPLPRAARIGLILPRSGRFAAVGEEILEGAWLALAEYERRGVGPAIDLDLRDDSSRIELAPVHMRDLEDRGVLGIVGPIRTEALLLAMEAKRAPGLVLVSPTATGDGPLGFNAYSLWHSAPRQTDAAAAIARYLTAELGLLRLGALYPRWDAAEGMAAFSREVEAAGGTLVAAVPYDPDSMSFGEPISTVAAWEPEGVFVMTDAPRTVLQLAPQLVYYGLRSRIIGGDMSWSDPDVVRRLEPTFADYRIVATYVDRVLPDPAWSQLEVSYEMRYRKRIPNSPFVALGYDAMRLVLDQVPADPVPRPGVIARRLRRLADHAGATGRWDYDSETATLKRRIEVKMLRDRRLEDPNPGAILTWAEQAREREKFLMELEEQRQKELEEKEAQRRRDRAGRPAPDGGR